MSARDRERDLLEQELDETDDPVERRRIMRELREIDRDEAEEEYWREEGYERGWH